MFVAERAILTTEAYKEHANKPIHLKRAYMLEKVLNNMSIFIEDQTVIVGNQASLIEVLNFPLNMQWTGYK